MLERKIELLDPRFKIHSVSGYDPMIIRAEYIGPVAYPHCRNTRLRTKDRIQRRIRHASLGVRKTWIDVVVRKYHCLACNRYFRARMPGILPYRRSMPNMLTSGAVTPAEKAVELLQTANAKNWKVTIQYALEVLEGG